MATTTPSGSAKVERGAPPIGIELRGDGAMRGAKGAAKAIETNVTIVVSLVIGLMFAKTPLSAIIAGGPDISPTSALRGTSHPHQRARAKEEGCHRLRKLERELQAYYLISVPAVRQVRAEMPRPLISEIWVQIRLSMVSLMISQKLKKRFS